mmetsp:Transcript_6069/g.27211  ORF Transcript_6069/g.27211 Transcript_6069/m.27211 type:complete len:530 (-) Transcript_6069:313-1902(-)
MVRGGVHFLQRGHARVRVDGIRGVGQVLELLGAVATELFVRGGYRFTHRGLQVQNLGEERLELELLRSFDLRGGDGRGRGRGGLAWDGGCRGLRLLRLPRRLAGNGGGRDAEVVLEQRDLVILLVEEELQLGKLGSDAFVAARGSELFFLREREFGVDGVELRGEGFDAVPGVGEVRLRLLPLFPFRLERLFEIRGCLGDALLELDHLLHLVASLQVGSPALLLGGLLPRLLRGGLRGDDLSLELFSRRVLFLLEPRERRLSLFLGLLRRLDRLVRDGLGFLLLLPSLGDGRLRGFGGGVLGFVDGVFAFLLEKSRPLLLRFGRRLGLGERELSLGEGNLRFSQRGLRLSLGGGDLLLANLSRRRLRLHPRRLRRNVGVLSGFGDGRGGVILGDGDLVLSRLNPRLGVVVSLRDLRLHLRAQALQLDALRLLRGDDIVAGFALRFTHVLLGGGDGFRDSRVGASLRLLLVLLALLLSLLRAFQRGFHLGGGQVLRLEFDLGDLLLEVCVERFNLLRRRRLDALNLLLGD